MENLSIKDIFKKAIDMEENGKIFYEYAVTLFKENSIKDVLKVLAEEEVRHRHIFENMLNNISNENYEEYNLDKEYIKYLNEFLTYRFVFDRKKIEETTDQIKKITDVIDFAIAREQDSIFYYMTLMAMVNEKDQDIVQQIINEERNHFIKLNEAKKLILNK